MTDIRQQKLASWLETQPECPAGALQSVSGDASFRRYFRYPYAGSWRIAVDAPPPHESLQPFMAIAQRYADEGVAVPLVHAFDETQGFMVLDDLGDTLLYSQLTDETAAATSYQQALTMLPKIMRVASTDQGPLPAYSEALLQRELDLFHDWLLETHFGLTLTPAQQQVWVDACDLLKDNALSQPQVGVHRDYHSRNIMQTDEGLAVIDFQDAVLGPITYDAVSLLRDCYVRWPDQFVAAQRAFLYQRLRTEKLLDNEVSEQTFTRWFDLMGIQRHLKAAGIFARLNHRDGKPGYMADVPRTLGYIKDISQGYADLAEFHALLTDILSEASFSCER